MEFPSVILSFGKSASGLDIADKNIHVRYISDGIYICHYGRIRSKSYGFFGIPDVKIHGECAFPAVNIVFMIKVVGQLVIGVNA